MSFHNRDVVHEYWSAALTSSDYKQACVFLLITCQPEGHQFPSPAGTCVECGIGRTPTAPLLFPYLNKTKMFTVFTDGCLKNCFIYHESRSIGTYVPKVFGIDALLKRSVAEERVECRSVMTFRTMEIFKVDSISINWLISHDNAYITDALREN